MALSDRDVSRFEDLASNLVSGYREALERIKELEEELKERGEQIDSLNAELEDAMKEPSS